MARISDDGFHALALAEMSIMAEFLTALDAAKRSAKGDELTAVVAALRAVRDSKAAAARAAELGRIKARQQTEICEHAGARRPRKAANDGPR